MSERIKEIKSNDMMDLIAKERPLELTMDDFLNPQAFYVAVDKVALELGYKYDESRELYIHIEKLGEGEG